MKTRRVIIYGIVAVIGVLVILGIVSNVLVEFWWFKSLRLQDIFWTSYQAKYSLWLAGFIGFFGFSSINFAISLRSAQGSLADPRIEKLLTIFGKIIRIVVFGGSAVVALIMAGTLSDSWMEMLTFLHPERFATSDPLFGNDIGFYVFTLPFIMTLRTWLIAAVVITLIGIIVVYVVRQGVSFATGRVSLSGQARTHISILAGILFILVAIHFYLSRYDILYSERSRSFFGAGYTDIVAQLPAFWILSALTLLCGGVAVFALRAQRYKRIVHSLIVLVGGGIIVSLVYPGLVQKFVVNPNEQRKELPFITNNIRYTREAYNLDTVEEHALNPTYSLSATDLADDSATIRNIMLWDYRPLASTLDQLQVIRLYYDFPDVDIDRYRLPDESYRQVMLSARELNQSNLPSNAKTWVNLNLVYTHGYGLGMSPVNTVTEEGLPQFFIKDIPPACIPGLEITRPEIYFGEETKNHVIVKGNIKEFDYPLGDDNRFATYQEDAGVPIGSFFRQMIFAMHFGDVNLFISGYLSPSSRILYHREIHDRVRRIAPFLHFDGDPYMVVANQRLWWIYDAYTTSSMYPYSRPHDGVNYIRNSVKVVIDAYNGDTKFYTVQSERDPIIRTYSRIFPTLFRPDSEMPSALRQHIRYPQDLFDIQSAVFETYHMEDPQVFYNKEDLWNTANEKLQDRITQMESYYAIMRLPGETHEEFILMLPYTPNRRDNMIAWLCARSDGSHYGKLLVYKFPKQDLTYGPMQVAARIDQDPTISSQLTLWNQQGSSVTRGNLLVIPVKGEVMYVQPVYLQATSGKLPELKRVIVAFGNRIAMENTLQDALQRVFGHQESTASSAGITTRQQGAPVQSTTGATQDIKQLSKSALDHFNRAQRFLKDGNWTKYGEELDLLQKDLEHLATTQGK